jgi:hypothetical protein
MPVRNAAPTFPRIARVLQCRPNAIPPLQQLGPDIGDAEKADHHDQPDDQGVFDEFSTLFLNQQTAGHGPANCPHHENLPVLRKACRTELPDEENYHDFSRPIGKIS